MVIFKITNDTREKGVLLLTLPQGIQCKWQIVKVHWFAIEMVNNFVNDLFKLNVFIEGRDQCTKAWKMSVHIDRMLVFNNHRNSIMLVRFFRSCPSSEINVILQVTSMYLFL